MKAIGFNQGQIGDLGMNMIACRAFKEAYPDSHLTFGINKKYQSIAPIQPGLQV
jgi:ADP-heptose:LPS heptosyltransferase